MERTRINAEGKELFASLYAVENILKVYEEKYHRLVDRIPNGWRNFRLAQSNIEKINTALIDTIPVEQLITLKKQLDLTDIQIGIKSPAGRNKNYWVMSYDDLADLADAATKTECFTCDGAKHNCRLRQILKDLPIQGVSNLVVGCWKGDIKDGKLL